MNQNQIQSYFDNNNELIENDTMCNSETNLIEIRHVGVTARIKSPLKNAPPECSTGETDEAFDLFQNKSTTVYSKFTASDETETSVTPISPSTVQTTEDDSKLLYEMHAERGRIYRSSMVTMPTKSHKKTRNALTKIEFKLHNNSKTKLSRKNSKSKSKTTKKFTIQKGQLKTEQQSKQAKDQLSCKVPTLKRNSFLTRLRLSLSRLFTNPSKQMKNSFNDLEQQQNQQSPIIKISSFGNVEMGFYPFERGCPDYLRATDSRPDLSTDMLAEHANRYATRFWAELFGALHIGVSLFITFLLQTYRFILYTLINTLLVGLLRMTSDYFLKPLLAILFNGFLQPTFIFIQNIFKSLRDALNPIADGLNNFMKPIATVGRSLRLIHAPRIQKLAKEV